MCSGRKEGQGPDGLVHLEMTRGSGLRARPPRLSALMLQTAAANHSAASSVEQSQVWSLFQTTLSGERYVARGFAGVGRLGTVAIARR